MQALSPYFFCVAGSLTFQSGYTSCDVPDKPPPYYGTVQWEVLARTQAAPPVLPAPFINKYYQSITQIAPSRYARPRVPAYNTSVGFGPSFRKAHASILHQRPTRPLFLRHRRRTARIPGNI